MTEKALIQGPKKAYFSKTEVQIVTGIPFKMLNRMLPEAFKAEVNWIDGQKQCFTALNAEKIVVYCGDYARVKGVFLAKMAGK